MKKLIKLIRRVKLSDRKLLVIIILILTVPYIYNFTTSTIKNYTETKRIQAIQEENEKERIIEQQKQQEIDRKIDTLIKQYGIKTLTNDGLLPSIIKYIDAQKSVNEYLKDYGLSCEDLANGVIYKSDSKYFGDKDTSKYTRDWTIRDCNTLETTKKDYDQFINERGLINKFVSENKESKDLGIKEFIHTLSINLTSIDLKIKLLK